MKKNDWDFVLQKGKNLSRNLDIWCWQLNQCSKLFKKSFSFCAFFCFIA